MNKQGVVITAQPPARMGLVEHFYSVQGEGRNAGRSAFFVRFAGCNLDCHFADDAVCDTPWQKAREKVTVGDILQWVHDTLVAENTVMHGEREAAPMLILTGGEPTMHPQFDVLIAEARKLWFRLYIAVETNGTIFRDGLRMVDWITVSPKGDIAQGANVHANDARLHPDIIALPPHEYRYVITGPDSTAPQPERLHLLPSTVLYLSPALEADGSGTEAVRGVTPRFVPGAVERCMAIIRNDPRWRLSLQTHKWLQVR